MTEIESFSLLEALRPPPGYRTAAALGTSYSADLVACLAAVVALDGTTTDTAEVKRLDALRALQRQRGAVRIACQQGRLLAPRGCDANLVALLDRIVRPVRCDARQRSFHPKVWVARQTSDHNPDRFVLVVGSRNLTRTQAWEMGAVVVGGGNAGKRVSGLNLFVKEVCEHIHEPSFAKYLDGLDDVRWEMPDGILSAKFGFESWRRPHKIGTTGLFELPRGKHVLLISPFLDNEALEVAVTHFSGTKVQLVAGGPALDKVAGKAPDLLATVSAFVLDVVDEDDLSMPDGSEDAEEPLEPRGLHAKVALVRGGRGNAEVVVGSPNLTSRAWVGRNVEAYLAFRCLRRVARRLEDWIENRAQEYTPPDPDDPADVRSDEEKAKEKLSAGRDALSNAVFKLVERKSRSRLKATNLPWNRLRGLSLAVTRVTQATHFHLWPRGRNAIGLPACEPADKTAFLILRLTCSKHDLKWVQIVSVSPPLSDARDDHAIAKILGRDGFHAFLRAHLGDVEGPEHAPPSNGGGRKRGSVTRRIQSPVFIEDLLRRIARAPDSFKTLQQDVARCRRIAKRAFKDDKEFLAFWATWKAIEKGIAGC